MPLKTWKKAWKKTNASLEFALPNTWIAAKVDGVQKAK